MKKATGYGSRMGWRFLLSLFGTVLLGMPALAQNSIFSIQNTPNPNVIGDSLIAGTAISANDAWAVGYKNSNNLNESQTLIMHWDGTAWATVTSPNPGHCTQGNFGNYLTAVAATSSTDVWAVGYVFGCNALLQPLTMHWNGAAWNVVPNPTLPFDNNAFNGVTALASNNVYAAGYQTASNGATLTLIEHWDGSSWSIVPTPSRNHTGNVLSAISASSPTDIWAVGDSVAPNVPIKTLALHFDGTSWKIVPTPNPLPTGDLAQNVLVSVKAISANNVTAVGYILDVNNLRELTMIQHWDGVKWRVVPSPNVDEDFGSFNTLKSVTALSGSDMYAIGFFANNNTAAQQETLVEHFDGTQWTILTSPTKGLAQQLNGVFGVPGSGNVWGVGAWARNGTDPEFGLLIQPRSLILFSPIG